MTSLRQSFSRRTPLALGFRAPFSGSRSPVRPAVYNRAATSGKRQVDSDEQPVEDELSICNPLQHQAIWKQTTACQRGRSRIRSGYFSTGYLSNSVGANKAEA